MYEIFEELLRIHGVKTADVCRATGLKAPTFSDWKRGKSKPNAEKMALIADYFGVSVTYLLTGKSNSHADLLTGVDAAKKILLNETPYQTLYNEDYSDCDTGLFSALDEVSEEISKYNSLYLKEVIHLAKNINVEDDTIITIAPRIDTILKRTQQENPVQVGEKSLIYSALRLKIARYLESMCKCDDVPLDELFCLYDTLISINKNHERHTAIEDGMMSPYPKKLEYTPRNKSFAQELTEKISEENNYTLDGVPPIEQIKRELSQDNDDEDNNVG